jgi:regulator of protease activity HflC (stomatin/prohibitin superfamily)
MRLFAIGYWQFVRLLQSPDTSSLLGPESSPTVTWLAGLFHPSVLIHLLPLALGWAIAYFTALHVIQKLYELPDRATAREFLPKRISPTTLPLNITEERLANRDASILLRIGGPGLIRVGNGNVITTEQNGRFYRMLGPGRHGLHRFEYIHTLLDLHPQERSESDVPFTTKEGIPVHTDITVVYRLSTGEEPPTKATPFPYSHEAVRHAAYAHTVKKGGELTTWQDIPLGAAKGVLGGIIAKYSLNELLQPENPAYDPHHAIKSELERKLQASLAKQGIDLERVRIGQFKLEQKVTDQFIKYWQSHWQKQSQIIRADGAANALEEIEVARAEAEITMLRAVLEGLQRAQQEGDADAMGEIFTLHLLEYLEKIAWQNQQIQPLPNRLLPQLQELQQLIAPQKKQGKTGDEPVQFQ